jgi:molybdate transport system substrate-binding protein
MRWLTPIAGLLLGLVGTPTQAETLRLAVAGNFQPTLERLAPDFQDGYGHRLELSSGATGKLYAQIRQGAPFDAFLAADAARPERLEAEGLAVAGTRVTYARGRLVLWAPAASAGEDPFRILHAIPPPQLALANPRLAPYGAAAEAFLRDAGLWSALERRAVRGEGIAQAFHFVATGNADLGLVALSQVRGSAEPLAGEWRVVPADRHSPIEQQAVLLRDSAAGREFLAWLTSEAVRDRLTAFGYDAP